MAMEDATLKPQDGRDTPSSSCNKRKRPIAGETSCHAQEEVLRNHSINHQPNQTPLQHRRYPLQKPQQLIQRLPKNGEMLQLQAPCSADSAGLIMHNFHATGGKSEPYSSFDASVHSGATVNIASNSTGNRSEHSLLGNAWMAHPSLNAPSVLHNTIGVHQYRCSSIQNNSATLQNLALAQNVEASGNYIMHHAYSSNAHQQYITHQSQTVGSSQNTAPFTNNGVPHHANVQNTMNVQNHVNNAFNSGTYLHVHSTKTHCASDSSDLLERNAKISKAQCINSNALRPHASYFPSPEIGKASHSTGFVSAAAAAAPQQARVASHNTGSITAAAPPQQVAVGSSSFVRPGTMNGRSSQTFSYYSNTLPPSSNGFAMHNNSTLSNANQLITHPSPRSSTDGSFAQQHTSLPTSEQPTTSRTLVGSVPFAAEQHKRENELTPTTSALQQYLTSHCTHYHNTTSSSNGSVSGGNSPVPDGSYSPLLPNSLRRCSNISGQQSDLPSHVFSSILKQRRGRWTPEEDTYCRNLIEEFEAGTLDDCKNGTTLRSYLSRKLHCAPMRISKKFAGKNIGKTVFHSCDSRATERDHLSLDESISPARKAAGVMERQQRQKSANARLSNLQQEFYASLLRQQAEQAGTVYAFSLSTLASSALQTGTMVDHHGKWHVGNSNISEPLLPKAMSSPSSAKDAIASPIVSRRCSINKFGTVVSIPAVPKSIEYHDALKNNQQLAHHREDNLPSKDKSGVENNQLDTATALAAAIAAANNISNGLGQQNVAQKNELTQAVESALAKAKGIDGAEDKEEEEVDFCSLENERKIDLETILREYEDIPLEHNRLFKSPKLCGMAPPSELDENNILEKSDDKVLSPHGTKMKFTSSFDEMHQFLGQDFLSSGNDNAQEQTSHTVSLQPSSGTRQDESIPVQRGPATEALEEQLRKLRALEKVKNEAASDFYDRKKSLHDIDKPKSSPGTFLFDSLNRRKNREEDVHRHPQAFKSSTGPVISGARESFPQLSVAAVKKHTEQAPTTSYCMPFNIFGGRYEQLSRRHSQASKSNEKGKTAEDKGTTYTFVDKMSKTHGQQTRATSTSEEDVSNASDTQEPPNIVSGSEPTSSDGGGTRNSSRFNSSNDGSTAGEGSNSNSSDDSSTTDVNQSDSSNNGQLKQKCSKNKLSSKKKNMLTHIHRERNS